MSEIDIRELRSLRRSRDRVAKKSKAKQIGVKSTVVTERGVAVSSYAEVMDAKGRRVPNLELRTDGGRVYRTLKLFRRAEIDEDSILLEGRADEWVELANPIKGLATGDYVGIKGALERKYFGREFPHDTLHVQIAYNIADLKKHITLFIDQIIYAFFNINRALGGEQYADVIGTLYTFADLDHQQFRTDYWEATVRKLLDGAYFYNAYYPDVFRTAPREADGTVTAAAKAEADHHNFNILRLLSLIRQGCTHEELKGRRADGVLYSLEEALGGRNGELLTLLDDMARRVPARINEEFETTAANNIYLLSQVLEELPPDTIAEEYYRFTVRGEGRNIGIDLKLLRGILIERHMRELLDKRHDSYRAKLYTLFGFLLSRLLAGSELAADTIAILRRNDGEDGRLLIYADLAERVWREDGARLARLAEVIRAERDNGFRGRPAVALAVKGKPYVLNGEGDSYFTKLMLLMTRFLDGKEINELLTGLISRFRNIADLASVAEKCGTEVRYARGYTLFSRADAVADELYTVKTIARMKPTPRSVENCMLLDAAHILGLRSAPLGEEDLTCHERDSAFLTRLHGTGEARPNHRLRNFLINNVVKSRWFFYVARYTRPSVCRRLFESRTLLAYVMGSLPDTQVLRYYAAVCGRRFERVDPADARRELCDRLHGFTLERLAETIEGMDAAEFRKTGALSGKQRSKALVGLYLTVAYLIVKGIVKVNAVFSIGFSCLERDLALKGYPSSGPTCDPLALSREWLAHDGACVARYTALRDRIRDDPALSRRERREAYRALLPIEREMHYTLHGYYAVKSNVERAGSMPETLRRYRNAIAHLNVPARFVEYVAEMGEIRSYYAVFVYCLERILTAADGVRAEVPARQVAALFATRTPERSLLWLLNAPFAYHMARYKTLSIEDLFYGRPTKERLPAASAVPSPNEGDEDPFIGRAVSMVRVEATPRGGLRGVIAGTEHKVTVSPKELPRACTAYVGRTLTVLVTRRDDNARAYNARLL